MDKSKVDEYLAKIRKTVDEANRLREAVDLRIAETDRFLAKQGLTREQVAAMRFTPEQIELVNSELKRRGYPPVFEGEELEEDGGHGVTRPTKPEGDEPVRGGRNFGMLMQGMRL